MNEGQDKTVYVFGAGASAACGVPTGKDFLAEGIKIERLDDDVRKFLKDMYGVHEDEGCKFPEFEQILTDLDFLIGDPYKKGKKEEIYGELTGKEFISKRYDINKLKDIKKELVKFICSVLRKCWRKSDKSSAGNYYKTYFKFVETLQKKKQLQSSIFISLNQDLFLDFALREEIHIKDNYNKRCNALDIRNEREIYYGKNLFNMDGQEFPVKNSSRPIKLFKLHGSINWYWCQNEKICRIYSGEPDKEPPTRHRDCDWDLEPNIYYPSFLKKVLDERHNFWTNLIMGVIWEITFAKKIIFIGYSFPQYDYDVINMFRQALFQNRENNERPALVEVVNPDSNAIERARELAFVIHRTYKTFEKYVATLQE
jgi:NAD-dependent SIR2 family protein deacetylase